MAKTKAEKKALLDSYTEILKEKPNYIIVDTDKASMTEVTQLKRTLRDSNGKFVVVKNTLFKIAAQETDQPTKIQELTNATGVIVCGEDPTEAAKALSDIQKEFEVMGTRFGVLFGEISEPDEIQRLAEIPSKDVLLAQLVGTLNAPLSGFAQVISGNIRDLVYALKEVQTQKAESTN